MRGAYPVVVDLPSRVSATECKASAEKKIVSWAVRQEKGNLLDNDSFRDAGNVKIGLENTQCDIKHNMKIKLQP